jgi:hypothetical protein
MDRRNIAPQIQFGGFRVIDETAMLRAAPGGSSAAKFN